MIDDAPIMQAPTALLSEVPAKGRLELTPTKLRFTSEFSGSVTEIPLQQIKEMASIHVKPSAGQIASGMLAWGLIGGAVYAAVVDNAISLSRSDSQGQLQNLKFFIESPKNWVEKVQNILKESAPS